MNPNGPVTLALEIYKLVQPSSEFAKSIMKFALVVGFLSFCLFFVCFIFLLLGFLIFIFSVGNAKSLIDSLVYS